MRTYTGTKYKILNWPLSDKFTEEDLKECGLEISEDLINKKLEQWVGYQKEYGDKARKKVREALWLILIADRFRLGEPIILRKDDSDYISHKEKIRWMMDHGKPLTDKDWDKAEDNLVVKISFGK